MQELDTSDITQGLDTSEADAVPGGHRTRAPGARKASVRLGIGALGVLLATGLGVAAADLLGLSDIGQEASAGGRLQPFPVAREEEPRSGLASDVAARPARPTGEPPAESPPAGPSPEAPAPPPAAAPADPPRATAGGGERSPVPARTGHSCGVVGQVGVTDRGAAAVCTASRGNGRNKWRAG